MGRRVHGRNGRGDEEGARARIEERSLHEEQERPLLPLHEGGERRDPSRPVRQGEEEEGSEEGLVGVSSSGRSCGGGQGAFLFSEEESGDVVEAVY